MALISATRAAARCGGRDVLSDIDCTLDAGQFTAVCGPNGAGKTTLLRLLAGLLAPSAGQVLHGDQPIHRLAPATRARLVGYLPQAPELAWPLTVQELVELGCHAPRGEVASTVAAALAEAGIPALAAREVQRLSGGERARVHLARLFAGGHAVLFADEPVAALDPRQQFDMLRRLRHQAQRGAAVVVVMHDLVQVARTADRMLLINEGRLVAAGPPREVLTQDALRQVFGVRGRFDPANGLLLALEDDAAP